MDSAKPHSSSSPRASVGWGLWPVAKALSRPGSEVSPTPPSNSMTSLPSRWMMSVSQSTMAPDSSAHSFTRS